MLGAFLYYLALSCLALSFSWSFCVWELLLRLDDWMFTCSRCSRLVVSVRCSVAILVLSKFFAPLYQWLVALACVMLVLFIVAVVWRCRSFGYVLSMVGCACLGSSGICCCRVLALSLSLFCVLAFLACLGGYVAVFGVAAFYQWLFVFFCCLLLHRLALSSSLLCVLRVLRVWVSQGLPLPLFG